MLCEMGDAARFIKVDFKVKLVLTASNRLHVCLVPAPRWCRTVIHREEDSMLQVQYIQRMMHQ